MRKSLVLATWCGLGWIATCHAQQPAASISDPKALMLAASKLNNLATADAKPWHIKASFQLFDEQGAVTDEGTYEEFWASAFQFKRTFAGKNFSQTAYGSKKGVLLTGVQEEPEILLIARNNLVHPLPDDIIIEHTTYATKSLDSGSVKLLCVIPSVSAPGAPADNSAYCLNTDEPVLRVAARPSTSDQTFHNRHLRLEDRAIAGQMKIMHNGKVTVALHVEAATVLDPSDEAVFTPPADAIPAELRITVSGAVSQAMLEYKVAPEYPSAARNAHVEGVVTLQGIIGKNGAIRTLKAIAGPEILQGAAMQAVQQWRYRPYLLNGQPVEVQTTINVFFTLSH
jgi:TonB family protein